MGGKKDWEGVLGGGWFWGLKGLGSGLGVVLTLSQSRKPIDRVSFKFASGVDFWEGSVLTLRQTQNRRGVSFDFAPNSESGGSKSVIWGGQNRRGGSNSGFGSKMVKKGQKRSFLNTRYRNCVKKCQKIDYHRGRAQKVVWNGKSVLPSYGILSTVCVPS